jgi:chromosome segregation ATPase
MDEKSGMNFSEYVAILSGNTDLLDKAKLEKQIAGLESEKQAFNRSKSSAKFKVQDYMEMLQSTQSRLNRMSTDWENLQQRLQKRSDGTIENCAVRWLAAQCKSETNRRKTERDCEQSPHGRRLS